MQAGNGKRGMGRHGGRLAGGLMMLAAFVVASLAVRDVAAKEVVHLSPAVRELPADRVSPVPRREVAPFLNLYRIVDDPAVLERARYVVAGEEGQQLMAAGDTAYVRTPEGATARSGARLAIYRPGETYRSPDSGEPLGIELRRVGDARWVRREGELDVFAIREARQEIRPGDRLLPYRAGPVALHFTPRLPSSSVAGHILGVPEGVHAIGRHTLVALDLGRSDDVTPGTLLALQAAPARVSDPLDDATRRLTSAPAGLAMVVESFARVSYALVTEASRPLEVGDVVSTPGREALTSWQRR